VQKKRVYISKYKQIFVLLFLSQIFTSKKVLDMVKRIVDDIYLILLEWNHTNVLMEH